MIARFSLCVSADGPKPRIEPHAEQSGDFATDDGDCQEPRDDAGADEEPGPGHVKPRVHSW